MKTKQDLIKLYWQMNYLIGLATSCGIACATQALWLDLEWIYLFVALACIDYVFALVAAKKNKKEITSEIMRWWIIKKFGILFVAWGFALFFYKIWLSEEVAPGFAYMLNILCIAELYSIIRHFWNYSKGKELPEMDVISMLVEELLNKLVLLLPEKFRPNLPK